MSIVRALSVLASQSPTRPPRSVAARDRVERRRHRSVPVTWIDADRAHRGTIVHLHGGGYITGETPRHWAWLEEVCRRSGTAGAMIHYRMPPRHPHPAALDDTIAALTSMLEAADLRSGRWVLSGDSAGAGLALAAAMTLQEREIAGPELLLLTSPWADLSTQERLGDELRRSRVLYIDGADPLDPLISPVHGDLTGLAPIHLTNGAQDDLVEDGRRLARTAQACGVPITVHEEPNAGHDFPFHGGPTAQAAQREQILAVRKALGLQQHAAPAAH